MNGGGRLHEKVSAETRPDFGTEAENALCFRRRKLAVALWIMGVGMLVALLWQTFQGWVLGRHYPYNTFLFLPSARYSDFTDTMAMANLPNPYLEPDAPYLPLTWVMLRPMTALSPHVSYIYFVFFSLAGLALILTAALKPIIAGAWSRTGAVYLALGCSYPIYCCIDRGNIELCLILLIAAAVYFIGRARYFRAMACLLPAICFKLYPALLLVLLVRQRKLALAVAVGIMFVLVTFFSLKSLALSPQTTWALYHRNMNYYSNVYVYENHPLEGSASLWNCYKVWLIAAVDLGLIAPVDFSFDAGFMHASYAVYTTGMVLLVLVLVLFACVIEKEFLRCAALLLLFFAIVAPAGGDYRLTYAGMALVLLVLAKTLRTHDWWVLTLLALTMVPKKEIYLAFAGKTESFAADVSMQVMLNPVFIGGAISFLLLDGWRQSDLWWSRLRVGRIRDAALGMLVLSDRPPAKLPGIPHGHGS